MYLAEAGVLFSGSSSSSKLLCLSVARRFCECESMVPSLQSLVTAKQLSFTKRAGWSIEYGAIRIIKSDISRLVSWSSITSTLSAKNAHCEWIKLGYWSCGATMWTKLRNSEEVLNQFILVNWVTGYWGWCAAAWKENSSRVQRRVQLVIRLIINEWLSECILLFILPIHDLRLLSSSLSLLSLLAHFSYILITVQGS